MATTIATVTPEQLDRCDRYTDLATGDTCYHVLSESDNETLYTVRYHSQYKKLSCNCKAGQANYSWCKHRTWAMAAEREFKALVKAEREAEARIAEETRQAAETAEQAQISRLVNQGCDLETATRVVYAPAAPVTHTTPYAPKAFSLMR